MPVVAIDIGHELDAVRACCDAGADDFFEYQAEETEKLARLVPLIRLSSMESELYRRARTASEFGVTVDTTVDVPTADKGSDLLVVGVDKNEFSAMCPMLLGKGIRCIIQPDPYRARSRLNDELAEGFAGALVYVRDGETPENCTFFFRSVRQVRPCMTAGMEIHRIVNERVGAGEPEPDRTVT